MAGGNKLIRGALIGHEPPPQNLIILVRASMRPPTSPQPFREYRILPEREAYCLRRQMLLRLFQRFNMKPSQMTERSRVVRPRC